MRVCSRVYEKVFHRVLELPKLGELLRCEVTAADSRLLGVHIEMIVQETQGRNIHSGILTVLCFFVLAWLTQYLCTDE